MLTARTASQALPSLAPAPSGLGGEGSGGSGGAGGGAGTAANPLWAQREDRQLASLLELVSVGAGSVEELQERLTTELAALEVGDCMDGWWWCVGVGVVAVRRVLFVWVGGATEAV